MRRVTVPFVAFLHPSPMVCSTLYQDDPSGASVAILMTNSAACAAEKETARRRSVAATAAVLFQEQFIHPPLQPTRLALRDEIGQAVFGSLAARVEGERAVQ